MIIKYVPSGYESKYKGTEVDEAVGRASKAASLTENNVFEGDNEFRGTLILGDNATATTPEASDSSSKVATTAYVKEQGYITGIVREDVIEALGYTPYDSDNPEGYISEIDSEMVVEALEYTPEDVNNKVTSISDESTDKEYPSAKAVYIITNENAQAIATNTANIETNRNNIATNTANIATNTADIATNRNNIATNTADIATNRNNISTNTANIETNRNNIVTNTADIATINSKIPSVATPENQLADKAFVNSSIATNTATFRGTYNSLEDLEAYAGPKDDNDYAFVISTDSAGNTLYNRYKYNGTEWIFEYSLNNSSFTAIQWASINSGANSTNIAQIATNASDITSLQNNKQDNITDLQTIREGAEAGSTALQPNDNISELTNNVGYITGISSSDVVNALGYTPYNNSNPAGYISGITSSDVTTALGYTPYNSTNPDGYISGIDSSDVVNALGYTPYDSTNPAGYISGITSSDVTTALGYTPYDSTNPDGYISGIDNSDVVDALGYTPYDSANPNGFITGISSSDVVAALGYTPYNSTNPAGYISSASISSLTDVTLSSISNGQALLYNSTSEKWENANIVTFISWGDITGTLSDQTDLQNALDEKASRFSATNPTLISSDDKCTWTITNIIGSKKVQVSVYEVYTYKEVLANVLATDSDITIELISSADIGAGTYEAIVVG